MRKSPAAFAAISLFTIIISTGSIQAQNYFPGPVGVGFTSGNINSTLEVRKIVPGGLGAVLRLTGGGEIGGQVALDMATFDASTNAPAFRILATDVGNYSARVDFQTKIPGNIGNGLANKMSLTYNGDLGIGTSNPGSRLHISGGHIAASNDDGLSGFTQLWSDNAIMWKQGAISNGIRFGSCTNLTAGNWTEVMRLLDNGNLGLGTTNPVSKLHVEGNGFFNGKVGIGTTKTNDGDFKLYVEGGVRTRKVKVDALTWSDYVFYQSYRLRPLSEVEQYIKQYGHLPEVPSEEEVKKEGIDLGDNQATLLKKIEELTLYVIQQNNKQENQEKLIQEQSRLLQAQQQRLEELEKQIKEKH